MITDKMIIVFLIPKNLKYGKRNQIKITGIEVVNTRENSSFNQGGYEPKYPDIEYFDLQILYVLIIFSIRECF